MSINEGFRIEYIETKNNYKINPISLISLKRAMLSFFSTYEGIMRNISIRDSEVDNECMYPDSYLEYYIDCIVFFQHFFELTIKDLLAYDSELLITTYKSSNSIKALYDLIHNNNANIDSINSVEFSDALERIKRLVDKIYPDGSFSFIKQYYSTLKQLNKYRNMTLHRGRFILKFKELDCFIGNKIFPIIQDIFNHSYYKNCYKKWKYSNLDCGIDPFIEIMTECKKDTPNHRKIALLKELGRAGYKKTFKQKTFKQKTFLNNTDKYKNLKNEKILAEAQLEIAVPNEHLIYFLDKCPVCGEKSIISFEDSYEEYGYDEDTGEIIVTEYIDYVASIKCLWCSYELDCGYIGDISDFGFKELKNYFK